MEVYSFSKNHPFSHWYNSIFVIDNKTYNSTMQWILHQKALLFGDKSISEKIMSTIEPSLMIGYEREIKNVNNMVWENERYQICKRGVIEKFRQNLKLTELLLSTGNKILCETSIHDSIWSCGLSPINMDIVSIDRWKGQNLLGQILGEVREILRSTSFLISNKRSGL